MKPISLLMTFCTVAALSAPLGGCGTANDAAPSVSGSGQHPALAVWIVDHRAAYRRQPKQCTSCHGADLQGGIAQVNCFAGLPGGQCHAGGHGPRPLPHPLPFTAGTLHGPEANKDLLFCQSCHGTAGGPGSNPRFNLTLGTLVNGCEDCHKTNTAHPPVDPAKLPGFPATWPGHADAGNLGNACVLCHGATLGGGVGPACTTCHSRLAAGVVPIKGTCVSCHDKPPATGNHLKHTSLSGLTGGCDACHSGAGSGTQQHGTRGFASVSTAIDPRYAARSGPGQVTGAATCASISCHGGITTPAWGGSIASATQCTACHLAGTAAQTPQYNSYFSGRHSLHLNQIGLVCTDCHDMTVTSGGAAHFSGLATPAFELDPRLTIRVPGYATTPGSCNPGSIPAAGTYSVGVCHDVRSWQ